MNQITVTAAPSMSQSTARLARSFVPRLRALRSNACPRPPSFPFFRMDGFSWPFCNRSSFFFFLLFFNGWDDGNGRKVWFAGEFLYLRSARVRAGLRINCALVFRNVLDGKFKNVAQGDVMRLGNGFGYVGDSFRKSHGWTCSTTARSAK